MHPCSAVHRRDVHCSENIVSCSFKVCWGFFFCFVFLFTPRFQAPMHFTAHEKYRRGKERSQTVVKRREFECFDVALGLTKNRKDHKTKNSGMPVRLFSPKNVLKFYFVLTTVGKNSFLKKEKKRHFFFCTYVKTYFLDYNWT